MNTVAACTLRARFCCLAVLMLAALASPCWAAGQRASAWIEHGHGVLGDPATGLEWTAEDNGQDIDWTAARTLCAAKKARWRLPTVDELESVYQAAVEAGDSAKCGDDVCHLSPLFRLSASWFWSSTEAGREKDDGRALFFGVLMANGKRTPDLAEFDYGSRVLCVRR